jgi:hypothetical protein
LTMAEKVLRFAPGFDMQEGFFTYGLIGPMEKTVVHGSMWPGLLKRG